MPRYDYHCTECEWCGELSHSIADCDTKYFCPAPIVTRTGTQSCGTLLVREVPTNTATAMDKRFQMEAIMSNGTKVKGHFGEPRKGKHSPGY